MGEQLLGGLRGGGVPEELVPPFGGEPAAFDREVAELPAPGAGEVGPDAVEEVGGCSRHVFTRTEDR
jgi:hypothetical protein